MKVRLLKAEDIVQAKALANYAFDEKSFADWFFDSYVKPEQLIGSFEADGSLKCMLCIAPYELQLTGKNLHSEYITTVTTAADARGKGYFRPLLKYTFEHLRSLGRPVAILKAIESKLYTPFGFAFCYNHLRYSMPLRELAYFQRYYDLQLVSITDPAQAAPLLSKLYSTSRSHNGMSVRTEQNWSNLLQIHTSEGGHIMLAMRGETVLGYMLYYVRNNTFEIFEMITTGQDVQDSFLNVAYQHRTQVKEFFWRTFADNTAYLDMNISQYADSFYPQLAPFMMVRVLDVLALLNGIITDVQSDTDCVCLKVVDEFIEQNNLQLDVCIHSGKLSAKHSERAADLTVDVGALAQLVFGAYSIDELLHMRKLTVHNSVCLETLRLMFPKRTNYINEEF